MIRLSIPTVPTHCYQFVHFLAGVSLGGSALAGQDYIQPTGFITIQEQTSCTTLQIDIISDIIPEATETFIVQLQPVSPSRLSATRGTTTVTIYDDDDPITSEFISFNTKDHPGLFVIKKIDCYLT